MKMNRRDAKGKILSELTFKIYKRPLLGSRLSWGKTEKDFVMFLEENRLEHLFSIEYQNSDEIQGQRDRFYKEHQRYENILEESLKIAASLLPKQKMLVVKTFSSFAHITSDLDILVEDEEKVRELQRNAEKNNAPLCIDVSTEFDWGGVYPISKDFIWRNVQGFTWRGLNMLVPNETLDALIRIGHMPYELAHIKLGELLHIYDEADRVDWKLLREEAQKQKWPRTYKRMLSVLEYLHLVLFGAPFLQSQKKIKAEKLKFPYSLSLGLLVDSVIEKKAWKKIKGSRFLIGGWIERCLRRIKH